MKDHYTYRVSWSDKDGEYVGLCAEFPSLSWLAPTSEEAFSGIRRIVSDCLSDMQSEGEEPVWSRFGGDLSGWFRNPPIANRTYSGKFLVSVPPETHRALVLRASEQEVSLNRLVSARLANDSV